MFDSLIESAVGACLPGLAKMTEKRAEELAQMRAKVRSHPEEVEAWFAKEIDKLTNVNVRSILDDLK